MSNHTQGCGCSSCLGQTPVPQTSCFKPCPCEETPYPCDVALPDIAMPVVQQIGCTSGCVELTKPECIACDIQPFLQSISVAGMSANFVLNTVGHNLGANYTLWVTVDAGVPLSYGNNPYRAPISGVVPVPGPAFTLTFLLTDTTNTDCDIQFTYTQ